MEHEANRPGALTGCRASNPDGRGFIRRVSTWACIAVALVLLGGVERTDAACGLGRQVMVGFVPDVFVTTGVATTRTITYTYRNIGGSWFDCGIYAQSTLAGVGVVNSYGRAGYVAFPPETTGVGPATYSGATKTWSFDIKVSRTAPAAAGTINLFVNNACDVCAPNYVLIGKVNVYLRSDSASTAFVVTATSSNVSGHVLTISHPLTNGNPSARLLVTPNWNPSYKPGVYNTSPIGVYYNGSRWAIFNEDFSRMPIGASFNVRLGGPASLDHRATSANIVGNYTVIDSPITNDNSGAIVLATHAWNPGGGSPGVYNNHHIGVWYTGTRWAIFNQDLAKMPAGAGFSVIVMGQASEVSTGTASAGPLDGKGGVFVHKAGTGNTPLPPMDHSTYLSSPLTLANACAIAIVTPNFNPGNTGRIYDNHPIGVWYDVLTGRWAIFHQDWATMSFGTAFNVLVPRPVPVC